MERLTEYEIIAGHVHAVPTDDADKAMMSLAAYEDTGLEPEAVRRLMQDWTSLIMTLDELGGMPHIRELVQAEKDGRLVVLPCKVGDTVYRIQYIKQGTGIYVVGVAEIKFALIWLEEFGKTVFLTREEAEAALKGASE